MCTNFKLSWESYKNNLSNGFSKLQQEQEFVDVTLAAGGHLVKAHQNIIAVASPYLKEMLKSTPCQHPVIFLGPITHKVLCHILEYIYNGEVNVPSHELPAFVQAAKLLHIAGVKDLLLPQVYSQVSNTLEQQSQVINENIADLSMMDINNSHEDKNEMNQDEIINLGIDENTVKDKQGTELNHDLVEDEENAHSHNGESMNMDDNTINEKQVSEDIIENESDIHENNCGSKEIDTNTINNSHNLELEHNDVVQNSKNTYLNDMENNIFSNRQPSELKEYLIVENARQLYLDTDSSANIDYSALMINSQTSENEGNIYSDNYRLTKLDTTTTCDGRQNSMLEVNSICLNNDGSISNSDEPLTDELKHNKEDCDLSLEFENLITIKAKSRCNNVETVKLADNLATNSIEGSIENPETDDNSVDKQSNNDYNNSSQNSGIKDITTPLYTISNRGSLQMVLNRYMYYLHHKSQTNKKKRWRCINYRSQRCTAFVDTYGETIVSRINPHTHSFHDEQILKIGRRKPFYTSIDEAGVRGGRSSKHKKNTNSKQATKKTTEEPNKYEIQVVVFENATK